MKAKKPCHFIFLLKKERFLNKEQPYANPLPPPPPPPPPQRQKKNWEIFSLPLCIVTALRE